MKKLLLISFLLFLVYAPFLAIRPIQNYYKYYETIAEKYDCYPIETCKADFNGDGEMDIFTIVDEPNEEYRHNYRLKIFTNENNQPREIFNIRYDSTDRTFRTHIAVAESSERKQLIIYDTINVQQFYFWDGNKLSPISDDTNFILEDIHTREIWKAMSLEDDTGGFNQKMALDLTLIPLFGLYYLMLLTTIGTYFYFKKKTKLNLS